MIDGWPYLLCKTHEVVWDADMTDSDVCPDAKPGDAPCDIRRAEPEEVARP